MKDLRPELAEFLGVFALVFVGCAAIATKPGAWFPWGGGVEVWDPGPVGIALAFGFTIMVMIYALGHVSGAHFNPAVTVAFAASGHFPPRRAVTYVLAQVAGATAAAFLLDAVLPEGVNLGLTKPLPGFEAAAFTFELVLTALLMVVILGLATDARASPAAAGLAIGGTVVVGALAAGGFSGGSFNPARSLGPAFATQDFASLWIYMTAPFAGALFGAVLYEFLRRGRLTPARLEPQESLGVLGPIQLIEQRRASATPLEAVEPAAVASTAPPLER